MSDFLETSGGIEKKIHISWKNKDIINKDYSIIKNGILNLKILNPDYEFIIYDDTDIENYLIKNLSSEDYNLIKNKKIVEKTDLWRLIIIYNEGGIYQDIDRLCNVPLSDIIKENTKCVLPMYYDTDFSQDIIISCSKNPIHKRAIELNLERRRQNPDSTDIMYFGPFTYFNAVTEVLMGYQMDRDPGDFSIGLLRNVIEKSPYLETYREEPIYNTILYRGNPVENDKDKMYREESVIHWWY